MKTEHFSCCISGNNEEQCYEDDDRIYPPMLPQQLNPLPDIGECHEELDEFLGQSNEDVEMAEVPPPVDSK